MLFQRNWLGFNLFALSDNEKTALPRRGRGFGNNGPQCFRNALGPLELLIFIFLGRGS